MTNDSRTWIHGLSFAELTAWVRERNLPPFRARQIWRWLYVQRVGEWAAMTDLAAELRQALEAAFRLHPVRMVKTEGEAGATRKLLLAMDDNEQVEEVLIPSRERVTLCVSSQVGCRFGCAFCASGKGGWVRNLAAGEMIGEVLVAAERLGDRPDNVVFMGIGEPMDNYEAVLKAIRIINDPAGLAIGARKITISTCGVIPGIQRLAQEGFQFELSVSLHAPDDALRTRLMPVNNRYPLRALLTACREYTQQTGRIITFEYTLVRGLNDSRAHAEALAGLLQPVRGRVNLIPLSSIAEFKGTGSTSETADMFLDILRRAGIHATFRVSKGSPVNAACGQLRRQRAAAVSSSTPS